MIYLDDAERGIAAAQASRAATLPEATEAASQWLAHATPIIRTYLALEDLDMVSDICANHYGRDAVSKQKTLDYREARGYVQKAQAALFDMLDGIRENYIADHQEPYPRDMSEADVDAADEFNEALGKSVLSVEMAVQIVAGDM